MEIEPIAPANLKQLTTLMLRLWPECSFEEEYEYCRKMLQTEGETAWLAKTQDGNYIAFILFSLRSEFVEGTQSSPVGYLEGIYVVPEFRGKGIGSLLLRAGEDWCRSRGCREMASDAELSNAGSQVFHQKAGFTEVNRIVCYQKTLHILPPS